eukprot:gene5992-1069_t
MSEPAPSAADAVGGDAAPTSPPKTLAPMEVNEITQETMK